jgi:hypothetical protein
MTQHHVNQPHAQALKKAGWEKETDRRYYQDINKKDWHNCRSNFPPPSSLTTGEWLPAPNLSELLDEITLNNLKTYWWAVDEKSEQHKNFEEWLYNTMKDPNALADIWLWVKKENVCLYNGYGSR